MVNIVSIVSIGELIWQYVTRNRAAKNLLIDQWFIEYYIMKRPL